MTTVTNELMFEVLKRIQERLDRIEENTRDISGQLQAMREHMSAQNKDISNVYNKLVVHDMRLERIERRLELVSELAN